MIALNFPQGSAEWLQARAGACTASRFADAREKVGGLTEQQQKFFDAIKAGKSDAEAMAAGGYKAMPKSTTLAKALAGEPYLEPGAAATRYAWLIAMESIAGVPLDDTFLTYAMRRGQELEPQARSVYESRTGVWVDEVSLILTDDRRFGYSADGMVGSDGLIEIKCPMACDKIGAAWENLDQAHLEYIDQINGGLWITGRQWCDLIIYCPWLKPVGKDLLVKRIYRDEAAIEALESDLVDFMRLVDRNLSILRAPTESKQAGEVIRFVDPEAAAAPATPAPATPKAPAVEPVAINF